MKRILNLFAVLILLSFNAFAQSGKYYVVFVKGEVILQRSNQQIKVGDALLEKDKLNFSSKTSKISCINSAKGRFEITYNPKNKKNNSEFISFLESNIIPSATNFSLSTRSVFFEGNDPSVYFSSRKTNNRILIIEDKPIKIAPSYKIDSKNFFFIQYLSSDNVLTSKIENDSDNNLIFSLKKLNIDFETAKDISLCYQYVENNVSKSKIIVQFTPVFVEHKELLDQINIIKKIMKGKKDSDIKKEIVNHLFENYGSIGNEEFEKL